jgi:hypothetical protein
MNRIRRTSSFLLFAGLLLAADPTWQTKGVSQWTADDARQVLTGSPWVRYAPVAILPPRAESQLREGGKLGGGGKRAGLASIANLSQGATLEVRWESAQPLRAAEAKASESQAPNWQGDYYAIAVYNVPGIKPSARNSLRSDLRQATLLKFGGKKDLKPARVEIAFSRTNTARVLYLFPRSIPIIGAHRIEFVAQIGRLYVTQFFEIAEMQFQGKTEL